jgi:hypothetical protein
MRTVKPIEPIRSVRGIRRITLRRVPSFKQLRMWLVFARQKSRDGPKRLSASRQAAIAPQEVPADREGEAQTKLVAEHGHVDKRV